MRKKCVTIAILILVSGIMSSSNAHADTVTINLADTPAPEGADPGTCWANSTYLPSLGIDASEPVWNLVGHEIGYDGYLVLNAFLAEVEAQNGKHFTSEAYALLKFNGKYLLDHL